jgi:predicted nucleic acid-binding protein
LNLVDSSGWLEYFADGQNAEFFATPIRDIPKLIVPTICIYEVFKVMARERGGLAAAYAISVMEVGEVVNLDAGLAMTAAQTSAEQRLAMADSIILATARSFNATLWTQDADFRGLEGVEYIETM